MEENTVSAPSSPAIGRLLWSRFIWRHWKREPRLTAVLVGILALGVAVFLAVRLANKAAVSGFGLFTESIAGESDFILRPRAGGLEASILRDLRTAAGNTPLGIFPVLEMSGAMATNSETGTLRIVGTDLVALQNAPNYAESGKSGFGEGAFGAAPGEDSILGKSNRGFVGAAFAKRFEVEAGQSIPVIVNDTPVDLQIAGVLSENPNFPTVPDNLVLMDLPGLQILAGNEKALSRIEFRIPPGHGYEAGKEWALSGIRKLAAERKFILETPEDRKSSVTQMSAAFRLNLTILSGLALLVGMYLILQAMEASVVKRRAEIAILRSLGVTPQQIRSAWLVEGIILGTLGAILGVVLGRLLAIGLVGAIAQTVNTIYYETTTNAVTLEWGEVVFALGFGLCASMLAAIVPAREASMTPPAQAMRQGMQGGGLALLRKRGLGLVLLCVGIACAFLPPLVLASGTTVPLGGYVAATVLVLSASILIGALFRPVGRSLGGRRNAMRHYAASQLRRPEGRHRLTAAGLSVAIGMSAAMGILVASFEHTLTNWIEQLLKADIYIAAAGANSVTNENVISKRTWQTIETMPGVAGMDKLRRYSISMGDTDIFLGGTDYNKDPERYLQLIWQKAPSETGPSALEKPIEKGHQGWASETLARRFDLTMGSRLMLPTPAGEKPIEISGIFTEYGNETGTLIVARKFTNEWFSDESISNMALYAEAGANQEKVIEGIREAFPSLVVRTNSRLRTESIRIFHQTFAVTYALEAIAVLIAISGLGMALTGLLLERRNELATLKSLGASRNEIASAAMWEGIGIALVGLIGGYLLSFLLGWILIYVINPQSFGWTLSYRVPWLSFLLLALITVATAGLVARLVGYRNAELQSEREE